MPSFYLTPFLSKIVLKFSLLDFKKPKLLHTPFSVPGLLNQFNNLVGVLFYVAFSQLSSGTDYTLLFYVLMVTPTIVTLAYFFVQDSIATTGRTRPLAA